MKTFEDVYNNEYLPYLSLRIKCTTLKMIEFKFKNHILPYFGKYDIKNITIEDYLNFQIKIAELNYSDSFNGHIHAACRRFFDYLGVMYDIPNIPAKIGTPKIRNNKARAPKKEVWTIKEFNKFIKKVDDPIYHAAFTVLFFTGLRKGELMALKISDLQDGYLVVNKALTKEQYGGERQIIGPKSSSSIRRIKLDYLTNIELKNLIKLYKKTIYGYNSDLFLFGGKEPIPPTTLERKKNYYCELAKVKRIRIHDFRHSHATMLYGSDVDIKAIQGRLGHSDVGITLETYVHINQKEEKRLIKKINHLRF